VAVKGRSLHQGGEPRGCGVGLWRGAEDPKVGQPAFVREEEIEWREAGLDGQDVSVGAHEAVGRSSLDLVQERGVTGALCRKTDPKIATVPKTQSRSKDQNKDKDNSK